jgi:antitoxin PrlF
MGIISRLLGRSTLTDRYQTTIPAFVREELGLNKRDLIEFLRSDDGYIMLRRAEPTAEEEEEFSPTLLAWLDLIAKDHEKHPNQFVVLDEKVYDRANELVGHLDLDLDLPLDDPRNNP